MDKNISIDYEGLREKLNVIEKDIVEIEDLLKEVDKETTRLNDEKVWKSNEKTKMDTDYIPYVQKISVNVPAALRKHLNHLRKALNEYQNAETEIIGAMEKGLEDLNGGE